jgi:pyruvate dehydrogenase E2 component (dihydrolipoamide acetyltransferase)
MESSDRIVSEQAVAIGGVRAVPAVRALARKLGVDIARVSASGAGGVVTLQDVKNAAAAGTAKAGSSPLPAGEVADWHAQSGFGIDPTPGSGVPSSGAARHAFSVGKGRRSAPRCPPPASQCAPRRRRRRAFGQPTRSGRARTWRRDGRCARQVVPTTICDDADIHAWLPGNDITVRLIRALVSACKTAALNAWFDGGA